MNKNNNITHEEIKKISSMSKSEIEQKIKNVFADSKNGALKKMIAGVDIESMKKKLKSASKEEIENIMGVLSKLDPSLINKIKDSLK